MPAIMGARGEYPVLLLADSRDYSQSWLRGIQEIPGVQRCAEGFRCTWDIAWAVARLLRITNNQSAKGPPGPPTHLGASLTAGPGAFEGDVLPPSEIGPLPGIERYRALRFHERLWATQKPAVQFLARRGWAILAEPTRAGKTLDAIAAAILVGAARVLVVCPDGAKRGWATEIRDWVGESALILEGRGGRDAREWCTTCNGLGELDRYAPTRRPCTECVARNGQALGTRIIHARALEPEVLRTPANARYCRVRSRFYCRAHPEVESAEPWCLCGICVGDLRRRLRAASWTVINYELLNEQHVDLGGGREGVRADLPGWVPELKQVPYDVVICDELHVCRGVRLTADEDGRRRQEKLMELVGTNRVPYVWGLTGTPFMGFTRDILWPLEIVSGGLFGGGSKIRGRRFLTRYCALKANEYGLEAKGRTGFAETELMRRLYGTFNAEGKTNFDGIMLQRSREELFADTPPIVRQVVRLELPVAPYVPRGKGKKALARAIKAVSAAKLEYLQDKLMAEVAEGNKIIVFFFHVDSARGGLRVFERLMRSRIWRARMSQVNAKVWLSTGAGRKGASASADDEPAATGVDGETGDAAAADTFSGGWAKTGDQRFELARAVREHPGAGVVCATIDSLAGMISFRGVRACHFLDWHWSPGTLAQAETRPWHPEVKDLSAIYYSARDTCDDHLECEVLPKIETLAKLAKERGAQALLDAMAQDDEERTAELVIARHVAHLAARGDAAALDWEAELESARADGTLADAVAGEASASEAVGEGVTA